MAARGGIPQSGTLRLRDWRNEECRIKDVIACNSQPAGTDGVHPVAEPSWGSSNRSLNREDRIPAFAE